MVCKNIFAKVNSLNGSKLNKTVKYIGTLKVQTMSELYP